MLDRRLTQQSRDTCVRHHVNIYDEFKEEYREARTCQNRSQTPPNVIKTQVIHTARKGKSILLFFPLSWSILHDRCIPIQTLIIALSREVILTVPKGAWATCVVMFVFSGWYGRPWLLLLSQARSDKSNSNYSGFLRFRWNFNMMKLDCYWINCTTANMW